MISRSFERPDRTVSRASDARNRYKIRYTRTQHRPASRHVNDHGRVSGTHKVPHGESLRLQRTRRGLTINAAAQALHTHTTRISALERGLYHNRDLAERYQQHLTQITT